MERYAMQELAPEDLRKLEDLRSSYLHEMAKIKTVEDALSPDQLALISKTMPEFSDKVSLLGTECAAHFMKDQVYALFERDPARFQELHDRLRASLGARHDGTDQDAS